MANSEKLQVTELDFDGIKENLKTFLKAQTQFKDYDFEGSGMSILLDTLAYNTHYLAYNANMVANEMFLDSAALRSSIVSHAKMLGYEVDSCRSSKAIINITLNDPTKLSAVMPAGTKFTTKINNEDYEFVTTAEHTASSTGIEIPFSNINIHEGTYTTSRYTVNTADVNQRFLIPSDRADTTTLTVSVQNSSTDSTTTTYTKATDISQLTGTSEVYFLQEAEAGKFEVYFGDGVVSKGVTDGNIVFLKYVVTNKAKGNGGTNFTSSGAIDGVTSVTIATVEDSKGGTEAESLQSIKLNAPLDYAAQGRCVTAEDYKIFAKKLFPQTQAVQVFGGESGSFDPTLGVTSTASYGRVFISIKSTTGNNLTSSQKAQLVKDFQKYNVASITPVIVDPDTVKLFLNVNFKFDSSRTTKERDTLVSDVTTSLTNYNNSDLKSFNKVFRHSAVVGLIDDTNTAILSNITNVILAKSITPTLNSSASHNIYFNNALYNPHSGHNSTAGGILTSTGFKVSGDTTNEYFFDDDGQGNVRRYYLVGITRNYVDNIAGTINYSTGEIVISGITISAISNVDGVTSTSIRFTVVPDSKDIIPVRNQILEIDFTNSKISGEVDTIAVSQPGAGGTYTTSSSYTSPSTGY
tara:strand:+ start:2155 stop:4062 length:1908 start_codon:yes stop_codon:yes gene_type:complete